MKKLFCILFASLMILSAASAEMDLKSMTNEELLAILSAVQNELYERNHTNDSKLVLFDQDGMQVYLTGITQEYGYLKFEAVFINDTDRTLSIHNKSCTLNGWDVYCGIIGSTSAHSKKKDTFSINMEDADITKIADFQTITWDFYAFDSDQFESIEIGKVTLSFDGKTLVKVD